MKIRDMIQAIDRKTASELQQNRMETFEVAERSQSSMAAAAAVVPDKTENERNTANKYLNRTMVSKVKL